MGTVGNKTEEGIFMMNMKTSRLLTIFDLNDLQDPASS